MLDVLLHWLRSRVKTAVLAGMADALGTLDGTDDTHELTAAALTARLQALPAPADGETTKRRK